MLDGVGGSATGLDATGAVSSLPLWLAAAVVTLVIVAGMIAFMRDGIDGVSAPLMQGALVLMVALAGWWALDYFARRDVLAERRVLDARALELATRAMAPGSALACLNSIAGEVLEDACEKALFATPEATAAAVSYIAAQLSLLASAGDHARRAGSEFGHVATAPGDRGRSVWRRRARARSPRWLHAGPLRPIRLAAGPQPGERKYRGARLRSASQELCGGLAGIQPPPGGEQCATRGRAPAGSGAGPARAEQPLLSIRVLDSAGQHHDRRAGRAAAP